jgi:protocatechuate 3,4-dioxygenase beta subunit
LRSRTLILVLLAAAAITLGLWMFVQGGKHAPTPVSDPSFAAAHPPTGPDPVPGVSSGARAAADPGAPQPDSALPDSFFVDGRVVDLAGQPLPEIAVAVRGDERDPPVSARSGAEGRFSLLVESTPCEVEVVEPGWATVQFGVADLAPGSGEVVVVAARALALAGVVVDPAGSALAGASVVVRLDRSSEFLARSGSDGRFLFDRLPAVPKIRLRTSLTDWRTDERSLALPLAEPLRIVLRPAESPGPVLEGTVVHPDGTPAPGALVALGATRTRAGDQGRFRLHCGWFTAETPLVATARGYQPAIVPGYGARIDPLAQTLPSERLQLPGPELALAGRVVDAGGTPLKGWRVRLEDPTPLDPGGTSRECVENESGGREDVRTDANGAFRITGLVARTYTLLAWGRDRASRRELVVRSEPVAAGTSDVLLRVDRGEPGRELRGRVVDETGVAVADALVGLGRVAVQRGVGEHALQGRLRARTGVDGRFEILDAPPGVLYLVATRPGFLPQRIELRPSARTDALVVRLSPLRPFRFESAATGEPPDRLRAAGANGSAELWSLDGAQPAPTGTVLLGEGRSRRLAVGPDAREIVIYRGLVELARLPAPPRASSEGAETLLSWP